jgi:hypothetical protein
MKLRGVREGGGGVRMCSKPNWFRIAPSGGFLGGGVKMMTQLTNYMVRMVFGNNVSYKLVCPPPQYLHFSVSSHLRQFSIYLCRKDNVPHITSLNPHVS